METNTQCPDILMKLINQKRQANPRYSLRAFARDVDIEQSNLCKILKGKRKLNLSQAFKISKAFHLSPEQTMALMESVQKKKPVANNYENYIL